MSIAWIHVPYAFCWLNKQRNQTFVVNSCPFSGYAGIYLFSLLNYMLHNFMFFHSTHWT